MLSEIGSVRDEQYFYDIVREAYLDSLIDLVGLYNDGYNLNYIYVAENSFYGYRVFYCNRRLYKDKIEDEYFDGEDITFIKFNNIDNTQDYLYLMICKAFKDGEVIEL